MQAKDTPLRALLTVLVTAVVCSTIVSASVVLLRPVQLNNQLLERSGDVMQLTGLLPTADAVQDEQMLKLFRSLDARVVDIDGAAFEPSIDPYTFDARKAAGNPELSVAIAPAKDLAKLGRRSRYQVAYLVWRDGALDRMILPVRGAGMWSMLHGYVALESDLSTLAGVIFYEQNETPGLGDQNTRDYWQNQWRGKRLFDETGAMLFHVAEGPVTPGSAAADFQVDALTGATVTANAVTALMRYWFGPDGYAPLLQRLREQPPERPAANPAASAGQET
jgi:Na+-transporting NADH:ubiquinone oxidoreductase subunit C